MFKVPTIRLDGGNNKIQFIVIHACAGSYSGSISWFKNPASQVSAHYIVSQKGEITQMVKDQDTAWHCYGINSSSVGVETEDKGQCLKNGAWITPALLNSTAELVASLLKKYSLTTDDIVCHCTPWVQAIAKKSHPSFVHFDPGPYFNLETFKQKVQQWMN